jgi:hypothetical protein
MTKTLFALVFLLGFRDQAYLIEVFEAVLDRLGFADDATRHASLTQLLRLHLGYRLEKSGSVRSGVRFSHPAYEEAVATAGTQDAVMESIMAAIVEAVYVRQFKWAIKAIRRHMATQPYLCAQLGAALTEVVGAANHLGEMVALGYELVRLYKQTKEAGVLDALGHITGRADLAERINRASSHGIVVDALRFVYNHDYWIGATGSATIADRIDWVRVFANVRQKPALHHLIDIMEWAQLLAPGEAVKLLNRIAPSTLVVNSRPLQPADRSRAQKAFAGSNLYERLVKLAGDSFGSTVAWRRTVRENASQTPMTPAIVIDGNLAALVRRKRTLSILPVGVVEVRGEFAEGEVISVVDPVGKRLGLAMAEYSSNDIRDIRGHHSGHIADILGRFRGPSVVSRRLMVWDASDSLDDGDIDFAGD